MKRQIIKSKRNRDSIAYRIWRLSIFSRDNFACVICGEKGKVIESHHIVRYDQAPELRLVLSNGITLCKKCHSVINRREHLFEPIFKSIIEKQGEFGGTPERDNTEPSQSGDTLEGVTTTILTVREAPLCAFV